MARAVVSRPRSRSRQRSRSPAAATAPDAPKEESSVEAAADDVVEFSFKSALKSLVLAGYFTFATLAAFDKPPMEIFRDIERSTGIRIPYPMFNSSDTSTDQTILQLWPDASRMWRHVLLILTACTMLLLLKQYKSEHGGIGAWLHRNGVRLKRVKRASQEIERKTFHITGLMVPLTFNLWLQYGASAGWCDLEDEAAEVTGNGCRWSFARFSWMCTVLVWTGDLLRLSSPAFAAVFPAKHLLRKHEQNQITGTCWFGLGSSLVITFFNPAIATASLLMLILGDMSAALVGVSFGGETVVVKLGREGKKSVEGSVAMFLVCLLSGSVIFSIFPYGNVRSEYAVFMGSMLATFTELYTDDYLGLDDNVTIPLFASAAMSWAFHRFDTGPCTNVA